MLLICLLAACIVSLRGAERQILFLVDSSGSMKQNDPRRLTAAACSAAVHLLQEEDRVALWEFDASARPLHSGWLSAGDWDAWLAAVQGISQRGQFTDFRAAFAGAVHHFSAHPAAGRRVLILLTDGVFEPDLGWEGYAPHSLEYSVKRRVSASSELNSQYHQRILPMARRLARVEIERLKQLEVEVFTIALGSKTETELLTEAARLTTHTLTELHSFEAARASELISIFASVLRYLGPRAVLGRSSGRAGAGESLALATDAWMRAPRLLVASDERLAGSLTQEGRPVAARPSGHESVLLAAPNATHPLSFRFTADAGRYQALLAAESLYRLRIDGLRTEYLFGEPVAGRLLEDLTGPATGNRQLTLTLTPTAGGDHVSFTPATDLSFSVQPPAPGLYQFSARARWSSSDGDPVERTTVEHLFEVLPAFSVRPRRLHFGELRSGAAAEADLVFHSGLTSPVTVRVDSGGPAAKGRALPEHQSFTIKPGERSVRKLRLPVPANADAGDWEGAVTVTAGGDRTEILWTAHLPSLWERVRWWLLLGVLLLAFLVLYLVYLWGLRPGPYGTLLPHGDCPGVVRRPIRLGAVAHGFFRRWLNWRRNEVEFRSLGLPRLPGELEGALVFYRWGTVMLSNRSRPSARSVLTVRDSPAGREITIVPGRSFRVRHGALIRFADCDYRFDNPR